MFRTQRVSSSCSAEGTTYHNQEGASSQVVKVRLSKTTGNNQHESQGTINAVKPDRHDQQGMASKARNVITSDAREARSLK